MSVKSTTGRLVLLGAVFMTGAVLVAGCGGDSDSGSDDFVASANQICADFNEKSKTAETEFTDALEAGDLEAAGSLFEEQADAMTAAIDDLEALEPPSDVQDAVDEFIALSRDTVDLTIEAADAVRNDDGQALDAAVSEADTLDAETDSLAEEAGLTDCVSADA